MINSIYKFANKNKRAHLFLPEHLRKKLENNQNENENSEECISIEDVDYFLDQMPSIDSNDDEISSDYLDLLQIIADQSYFSEISSYLYENKVYAFLFQQISDPQKNSNQLFISYFLQIMNNILSLPGDEITEFFLSEFQDIFNSIFKQYSNDSEIVPYIFDTFLIVMRPPIDSCYFIPYFPFFIAYLEIPNPCENPDLTVKSFKCCNKMFNIKNKNLKKLMFEEERVLKACCIHMNRKTPSFFEACRLLGNIGEFNRFISDKLDYDFFTQLIGDILQDEEENDDIVASIIMACNSLATNDSICSILIEEKSILEGILNTSDRSFEVKKCSIKLLTTLFESDSIYLLQNLIDHGTLDFFVNFLEAEDDNFVYEALLSLIDLILHFVTKQADSDMPPPFVEVLKNSQELIECLEKLSFDEDAIEKVHEASTSAYHQCLESLGIEY